VKYAPAASVPPSRIREIGALVDEYPGTLRLLYGEDTLPTPEFIKEAAKRALDANCTYYTPNAGYPALREAIAAQYGVLHNVELDPTREVVVTGSGMVAIAISCQATVGPGDSALVITPLWPNIPAALRVAGAEVIEVPLALEGDRFELDFEQLEAAVRPNTRVLALASPGNPTGWTASAEDWRRLVGFCERHDLWLLADGVYERLVFDGTRCAPGPLECSGARERTIVIQSFSKVYRMTGWRIGYALAPAEMARRLATLQEFDVSHAAGVAQEAARTAILEGEPFVAESQARYARHCRLASDRLSRVTDLILPRPAGAFYLFPLLVGLADSLSFCQHMVREYRIGVAPGSAFGAGGEGHVRLCFAVDESTLREGLDRFEDGWLAWRGRRKLESNAPGVIAPTKIK
jgi:aspartate aminotransferase